MNVHVISEDPATGSAAVALGGYLSARTPGNASRLRWVVEQGFEMGRASLLEVEVDRSEHTIRDVRVGGSTVLVSEGRMRLPI